MFTSKNKNKIFKKALCLFFALLLSINSFAAVVSDNDGAAFVTKAEFEGLKKDFADQITNYNTSIDSKIDGAIASYLAGMKLSQKVELTSMLNQLSSFHFSRVFNKFGNSSWSGTRIGDRYNYWSYYGATFGIDKASQKNTPGHRMIGVRGGTGIMNISEMKPGSLQDRYIVCTKSNFNNTKPKPAYGMSTLNYYSMMWLTSNYGTTSSDFWDESYFTSRTGTLSSDYFGTEFVSESKPDTPPNRTAGMSHAASLMYTCVPVDTVWPSGYDANCLVGTTMSTTDECMYIWAEDLMKKGEADGTINLSPQCENMYWEQGAWRTDVSSLGHAMELNATKYKRKYNTIKWFDYIVDSVALAVNKESYYYSGLPLFTATNNGKVKMKIKPTNTANAQTVVAISADQFDNSDVGSGGISLVPNADCEFTNWTMDSGTEYEITWTVKKDTTYWIKACPVSTGNRTTFTTSSIILETE